MKVLKKNHLYELPNFENPESKGQTLQFIEKKKENDSLVLLKDGTTNEDVICVLIDRLNGLNEIMKSNYNDSALFHLKAALKSLEQRTLDRVSRNVEGTSKA